MTAPDAANTLASMPPAATIAETLLCEQPPVTGLRLTSPRGRLTACVAPGLGGELSSLRLAGWGELLYRANQFEPTADGSWRGRGPLLWPAVGRNYPSAAAIACGFVEAGRVWPLPLHGFAHSSAWALSTVSADTEAARCELTLTDSAATRAVYPWPFALSATHVLTDDAWSLFVGVGSTEALRFGLGHHLTLALPDYAGTGLSTSAAEYLPVTARGLLDPPEPLGRCSLAEAWTANAGLGGCGEAAWLRLELPGGPTVTVSQRLHTSAGVSPDDRLFVLYGDPARGFFCPEPWLGRPNGLQTGDGAVHLPPGAPFVWEMRVELT